MVWNERSIWKVLIQREKPLDVNGRLRVGVGLEKKPYG